MQDSVIFSNIWKQFINKALFDLCEYDDVLLASHILTCTTNRTYDENIILAQDRIVVFTYTGLQVEKKKASIRMASMDLLHAIGTPIQLVGKAITAEAQAICEALKRALQKGWSKVYILSDTVDL